MKSTSWRSQSGILTLSSRIRCMRQATIRPPDRRVASCISSRRLAPAASPDKDGRLASLRLGPQDYGAARTDRLAVCAISPRSIRPTWADQPRSFSSFSLSSTGSLTSGVRARSLLQHLAGQYKQPPAHCPFQVAPNSAVPRQSGGSLTPAAATHRTKRLPRSSPAKVRASGCIHGQHSPDNQR